MKKGFSKDSYQWWASGLAGVTTHNPTEVNRNHLDVHKLRFLHQIYKKTQKKHLSCSYIVAIDMMKKKARKHRPIFFKAGFFGSSKYFKVIHIFIQFVQFHRIKMDQKLLPSFPQIFLALQISQCCLIVPKAASKTLSFLEDVTSGLTSFLTAMKFAPKCFYHVPQVTADTVIFVKVFNFSQTIFSASFENVTTLYRQLITNPPAQHFHLQPLQLGRTKINTAQ